MCVMCVLCVHVCMCVCVCVCACVRVYVDTFGDGILCYSGLELMQ